MGTPGNFLVDLLAADRLQELDVLGAEHIVGIVLVLV